MNHFHSNSKTWLGKSKKINKEILNIVRTSSRKGENFTIINCLHIKKISINSNKLSVELEINKEKKLYIINEKDFVNILKKTSQLGQVTAIIFLI